MNIFWGMKIFLDIFWGSPQNWPTFSPEHLGVISMHFGVFSYGQGMEWRYFLGLLKFQIFLGVLEFLIFF